MERDAKKRRGEEHSISPKMLSDKVGDTYAPGPLLLEFDAFQLFSFAVDLSPQRCWLTHQ